MAATIVERERTFELMPQLNFNIAGAVVNTWYTALATTRNVRLLGIGFSLLGGNETLEIRMTIDSQVITAVQAALATIAYYIYIPLSGSAYIVQTPTPALFGALYTFIEARSVKIEIRKTTNTAAVTLYCDVTYEKL